MQLAQYSLVRLPRALCASRCINVCNELSRGMQHMRGQPSQASATAPHMLLLLSHAHLGPGLYLYKFDRKSTAPETAAKFVQVSRARVPVMQICMYLHAFYVRNYHSRPENAT